MSELVSPAALPAPSLRERADAWFRNWRRLSRDNRSLLVIALLAALVAAIIVVILWTASQNYVPLYGKQEMYDTANILELLEKSRCHFVSTPRPVRYWCPRGSWPRCGWRWRRAVCARPCPPASRA